MNIQKETIATKPRKLKARWTIEPHEMRWHVKLEPGYIRERPWGVYLEGFRDSSWETEWLAKQRCAELNSQL